MIKKVSKMISAKHTLEQLVNVTRDVFKTPSLSEASLQIVDKNLGSPLDSE
jgi:hypothetical protein